MDNSPLLHTLFKELGIPFKDPLQINRALREHGHPSLHLNPKPVLENLAISPDSWDDREDDLPQTSSFQMGLSFI